MTNLSSLGSSLQTLNCYHNSLVNLPSLPNSLIQLDCHSNILTSLPNLPNSLQSLFCDSNNIACFPIFPNSISLGTYNPITHQYFYNDLNLNNNPYNCLPNYIPAMGSYTTTPLCTAGNTNSCPIAATGIEQYNTSNIVGVYPNPTMGVLNIEGLTPNSSLQITDVLGNEVITTKENQIDVSTLPSGVYFIKTTQGTSKFIKQ